MKYLLSLLVLMTLGSCGPGRPHGTTMRVAVHHHDKLHITEIELERYLLGVLQGEVPADWPMEALKAQAVASRTYALYRKEHPRSPDFDLEASVRDQVLGRHIKNRKILALALRETDGEVLLQKGQIIPAFFHSCCGGMSEGGTQVWPGDIPPALQQVRGDPYCESCPRYHWELHLTREELTQRLGRPFSRSLVRSVTVQGRDESGRVTLLKISSERGTSLEIKGPKFREQIGYTEIYSTLFDVLEEENGFLFTGKGSGHGVGLCQWGAKAMADEGKSYQDILEFYYPGTQLTGQGVIHETPGRDESRPYESETEPTEVDPE